MNKTLLFSVLALTACAFADGDSTNVAFTEENLVAGRMDSDCKPKPKPRPCEPCVRQAVRPVVLTSSRPCSDAGIYFFGDALYWHADVGNSDWAFVNTGATPGIPSGPTKETTFKWNFGFRAGIGINFDHDQWDSNIYYTWFRNHHSHNHDNTVSVAFPSFANSLDTNYAGTFTTGEARARLNFNVVDWELGRWFYVSKSLSLRPHAGLKGSWIKLRTRESLTAGLTTGAASYTSTDTTKSWSVGPAAGLNSNWYFGCGDTTDTRDGHRGEVRNRPHFSIFADFAGALMFSHFKNHHSEAGTTAAGLPAGGFNPTHLNRNLVVPVLTSIAGLAWDTCFDCDKMHFGIRLGYEFQWWFRQHQRLIVEAPGASSPRYIRFADDLALQGVTLDLRFDF